MDLLVLTEFATKMLKLYRRYYNRVSIALLTLQTCAELYIAI